MKYNSFPELTVALYRKRIQHCEAAKELGISTASFQRRMTGQQPWTLDEMYRLSDLLNITTDQWGKMFPNIYKEA